MRIALIVISILTALSCAKKDDLRTDETLESKMTNRQESLTAEELEKAPHAMIADSVKNSKLDSVFTDYEYPASILEDTFSMSSTVSCIYKSSDEFAEVVEFYKKKFPDAPPQTGTTVYFGKTNTDGSGLTVTITKLDHNTQIILRLDKKI